MIFQHFTHIFENLKNSSLMQKLKTAGLFLLVIVPFLFASCSNKFVSSTVSSNSGSRKPRFIDDIEFAPSANNSKIKTAIPPSHISKEEKKRAITNDTAVCVKYAEAIGLTPRIITNSSLYSFIEEWYGVPYRYGGNDKSGIDCSAFVQQLYEHVFGINLVRTAFEQFNTCRLIKDIDSLKEGDLVFFHTIIRSRKNKRLRKHISHVGIYLANNYFVHASTSCGVMISNLNENYWAGKFAGAGQIPRS